MLKQIDISPDKQKLIIYLVLAVVTVTVFWQVNQFDFVNIDDNIYVTENIHLPSGLTLEGMRWAFSTTNADFWHPLTWLSLMFDYQLYGLNAGGYHLTNLILHTMSALLLFWLFNRMTGTIWRSAFVAALFAIHPLHVESVVWIAERKDVLSAFFWMLTLCLYVYYTEKPVIRRYLFALFSFVCALMSKPMVVTLPIIMIALDYWPLKRFESKRDNWVLWQLREKLAFFVFSAVFSIITLYAKHESSVEYFSLYSRIANSLISFVAYLEKTFWPHDMAMFYPFPSQIPVWQVLAASLLILLISSVVIVMVKRMPYLFVGWLWYSITILPVIGIIQIGSFAMADRYHYLPSIGIAVGLAWGIPYLIKSEETRKKILFPAAIAALAILSVLTWQQCGYWKNSVTLYNHALQVTKDNYLAHNNLGVTLVTEGKTEEAIYHYNMAIRQKPDYVPAHNNRGNAYFRLGRYERAIEDYNEAIRLKPDYVEAYNNRGNAYFRLGQYKRAIEDFNKALRQKSDYVEAYNNRGSAYFRLGQHERAIEDYNEAIRLKPDYVEAYNNRGLAYFRMGNNKLCCLDVQKVCALGNCKLLEDAKRKGLCR